MKLLSVMCLMECVQVKNEIKIAERMLGKVCLTRSAKNEFLREEKLMKINSVKYASASFFESSKKFILFIFRGLKMIKIILIKLKIMKFIK